MRGARLLGGWGFWAKKNDLIPLWPPSFAAFLHLLEPGFIGRFLSGIATEKGNRVLFLNKSSVNIA